ncbi:MAG: hypothetical protein JKY46_08565 [Robiginitomaculum sp.]|nr:hypothetical protein [Robiginitomaculum sp.]
MAYATFFMAQVVGVFFACLTLAPAGCQGVATIAASNGAAQDKVLPDINAV